MPLNFKQTGSLLPYFIISIVLCLIVGIAGNYLIKHVFGDLEWWVVLLIVAGPVMAFLVMGDFVDFVVHNVRKRILKLRYFCPCCGFRSLEENSKGSAELCDVCGWKQDYLQYLYKNREEGLNPITFIECQQKIILELSDTDRIVDLDRDPYWLASQVD